MKTIRDEIVKQLQEVYDPEISINVFDLGLIYDIQINEEERSVEITHTLTSAFCGFADVIAEDIKNAAVDGKIETVLLKSTGSGYSSKPIGGAAGTDVAKFSINVPIIGDGEGGLVEISVDGGVITSMQIANGGTGYTYGLIRFEDGVTDSITGLEVTAGSGATFEVVIPPKGGHGADIYRELGGFRVMVHSRFDNNVNDVPDYIINNDFSRVGIVKNPIQFGGTDLLNSTTATNLSALKLKPADGSGISTSSVDYIKNSKITQTIYSLA